MQTITIDVKDPKDAEMIILLAKRLDCIILPIKKTKVKPNSKEALKHLKKIAERGTLAKAIPDPVKWQKEIHNDRKELAKIFKSIAKRGTLAKAIPDPVKWQREIRKDKPLVGREV